MSKAIYLIQDDGTLVAMAEAPYDSEDLLQELLAKYPDVLAGDQIGGAPHQWLLVTREMGVPSREDGGARWSADHLFLDQDAIPTIVEVKRSTDTRIRREVVGQMLDYAANAVVYWPEERLRAQFEAHCAVTGLDPQDVLTSTFGPDIDQDQFWAQVGANLRAGRVRLVFIADLVPPELQRIVEFLNGQMNPAEVIAVEVRQYVGKDLRTLVPRVIGETAEAQRAKGDQSRKKRKWDEASFMADLTTRRGPEDAAVAERILRWARDQGLDIWWGEGEKDGSFFPMLRHGNQSYWTVSVWTYGRVEVQFQVMRSRPPFDDEMKRLALARELSKIAGIAVSDEAINRRPSFPLSVLKPPDAMEHFLGALEGILREIKNYAT
jgi:hypothetical protein